VYCVLYGSLCSECMILILCFVGSRVISSHKLPKSHVIVPFNVESRTKLKQSHRTELRPQQSHGRGGTRLEAIHDSNRIRLGRHLFALNALVHRHFRYLNLFIFLSTVCSLFEISERQGSLMAQGAMHSLLSVGNSLHDAV
jgi:hypothetical protein